jgi:hypothetical protein
VVVEAVQVAAGAARVVAEAARVVVEVARVVVEAVQAVVGPARVVVGPVRVVVAEAARVLAAVGLELVVGRPGLAGPELLELAVVSVVSAGLPLEWGLVAEQGVEVA